MRLLIFGLSILLTAFSCSGTKKKDNEFKNIVFDDTISSDKLKPLDSTLLKKWNLVTTYRRYFKYSDLGGEFHLKVIKETGDDYSGLLLMTFDNNGNNIDGQLIAGGPCGGPSKLKDKIDLCPYLKSIMISDTELIVREIHQFTTDTVNWDVTEKDSIEWRIFIDKDGKVKKRVD